jgi:hypothetical protein
MHSSILKRTRIAAMLFLVLGVASSAWATCPLPTFPYFGGAPPQIGDMIVCFGTGTCNLLRIVNGSPKILDQISDLAQSSTCPPVPGVANPGDTRGVTINNTLHAVVTDNGVGGDSNVVVFSIASLNPNILPAAPIAHTPVAAPFNASGGSGSGNAQAVVVNGAGHIFVGNAGSGGGQASIVELNPNGNVANTFAVPSGCIDAGGQFTSMDLSSDGNTIYFTSGGTTIQKLTLSPTPGFGSNPQPIAASSGATESNTTVTITTSAAHGFIAGQTVVVSGVGVSGYNGCFTVLSVPTPTTFTYTASTSSLAASGGGTAAETSVVNFATSGPTPATPAVALSDIRVIPPGSLPATCNNGPACPTGESLLVVAKGSTGFDNDIDSGSEPSGLPDPGFGIAPAPNGATESSTTVTITTLVPHNFLVSDLVTVAGVGVSGYNGTFSVDSVPTSTTFTYTAGSSGFANSGGGTASGPNSGDDALVDVCTGTTPGTTPPHSCALLLNPATGAIFTRYQTSQTDLQALTLDPLVRDCSTGSTSSTSGTCPISSVPTVSNFWLGDSGSSSFYEVNFGSGTVSTAFDANADCSTKTGCNFSFASIQGLGIYGGEGANQADLTKLASGNLDSTNFFTQIVQFPLPVQIPPNQTDTNKMTVTLAGTGVPASSPFAFYASLISQAAPANDGGNNSGATDVNAVTLNPPVPCQPTTSDFTKCIVWKLDVPTPTPSGPLHLPFTVLVDTSFQGPTNPVPPPPLVTAGVDNGTDVFVDLHYDVTTTVGNFDPGGRSSGSVHSLHEIPTAFPPSGSGSSGCFYVSPTPDGACFKSNRTTLPFVFQCTGLTPSQMASLQNSPGPPLLSIVQTVPNQTPKPAPKPIFLTGTNSKPPYRYDATANDYVFNWSLPKGITGTFRACTIDPTNTVQTFCTNFKMQKTCP